MDRSPVTAGLLPHPRMLPTRCASSCGSVLGAVCCLVLVLAPGVARAASPNVLLIMTDDQGYGDIRSHGNAGIETPVLDRLADEGARFDRFYVSPVCSPTRAALLTGRYPLRSRIQGTTRGWEVMPAGEMTLAEVLQSRGYVTAAFGKWHNGRQMPNHPNGQGFDEFFGFCGGHWNDYTDAILEHNRVPTATTGYITDVLTDRAIDFIGRQGDAPWFCYVPYNAPHSPWVVPDEYWERFEAQSNELDAQARAAYAMVENLDHNIGRILEQLSAAGMTEETIVIFLTDNGPNSDRYNGGMRGRKGSEHEGGVRVPCFVRWPGRIPAGRTVHQLGAHIDVLPTVLSMCGFTAPPDLHLDGNDLSTWLLEPEEKETQDRTLFTVCSFADGWQQRMRGAVRTERWRATTDRGQWQLFDMQRDAGQEQDVAAAHPLVVRDLAARFDAFLKDATSDGLDYIPIPIGHRSSTVFELAAWEAFLELPSGGGLEYTGKGGRGYSNCFLTNWADPDAYARWEIEVLRPGRYAVEIDYACRAADVGTELVFSIGDERIAARVTRPHDPPLLMNEDRVDPTVYVEKVWGRWPLGEVDLPAGAATVTLKSRFEQGKRGIEMHKIRLLHMPR